MISIDDKTIALSYLADLKEASIVLFTRDLVEWRTCGLTLLMFANEVQLGNFLLPGDHIE